MLDSEKVKAGTVQFTSRQSEPDIEKFQVRVKLLRRGQEGTKQQQRSHLRNTSNAKKEAAKVT